jgi:putative ABC transport system ATP-binding protein
MATIEARGLTKLYGKGDSLVRALDGLTLTIEQGEFVAIVGRSGSGKTTTLDCMGLLMRPSQGQILVDGVEAGALSDNQRAEIRSRRIGFIFQEFNLLPTMSAMENVLLPLRYSHGDRTAARKRAEGLLEEVGLARRWHHRPTQMSGGEQQRVAIARALANRPRVIVADEPTGNLDSANAGEVMALLGRLQSETGVTVVVATHDPDIAGHARRHVRMRDGAVTEDTDSAP